jgi:hypothetical protein
VAARSPCSTILCRDSYERRRSDETLLYQLIEEHWPTYLERAEQSGGLPGFIVEEFEAYLRCDMLEHGLAHLACRQCGESLAVAYSCKKRGSARRARAGAWRMSRMPWEGMTPPKFG